MLGYKYEDVEEMILGLNNAVYELDGGAMNPSSIIIDKTIDLLNGLLEEGHVQ